MKYNEIFPSDDIETSTKLVEFIHKNCKEWLEHTHNGSDIAYRGVKNPPPNKEVFIKDTRTDRYPLDSYSFEHEMMNVMIGVVGGTANRSNSLFCTGMFVTAENYGTVYIIFPIGDFDFTWSNTWGDWHQIVRDENIEKLLKEPIVEKIKNNKTDLSLNQYKQLFMDPNNYDEDVLYSNINVNGYLSDAISSGNEIMISCKKALYIDPAVFDTIENKL